MEIINFKFKNEHGMHARPSGQLSQLAMQFESVINVKKDEKDASAKGVFSLMSLGIKKGDSVVITIEGEDEKKVKEAIAKFLEDNFSEDKFL